MGINNTGLPMESPCSFIWLPRYIQMQVPCSVLLSIFHSPYLLKTYTFFMLKPNHLLVSILLSGHCMLLPHSSKVDQAILFFPLYFISFIRAGKFTVSSSHLIQGCMQIIQYNFIGRKIHA